MKNSLFILLIIFLALNVKATHIIGGTMEYTINSVQGNTIDIDVVLYVYRDANSNGADFDQSIEIGVYGGARNDFNFIRRNSVNVGNVQSIDFGDAITCDPLFAEAQSAEYRTNFLFNIDDNDSEFIIAYQRCCRSGLDNIVNGEETGMALSVLITRTGITKLGTVKGFKNIFPIAVEPSKITVFDASIEDGLEKAYYLSKAQTAGGTNGVVEGNAFDCIGITPDPLSCPPPFDKPEYRADYGEYGLRDEVTMDVISGELSIGLTSLGSYLYALESHSFENGELLSIAYQQFIQFVDFCDPNTVVEAEWSSSELYPVPTLDVIYFEYPLKDVEIYDDKGSLIVKNAVLFQSSGIDISSMSEGVYMLKGTLQGGKQITKRFIKG